MKFLKFAIAAAFLPLLAACAAGPDTAATKMMANAGSAFNKALQMEYVALAEAEAKEYDTEDAFFFNNKALAAARGEDVQPQEIKERTIKGDVVYELEAARQGLRAYLVSGSKDYAPAESARAQAMFDCWLQEQEEGDQPKDINACKSAFDAAMAKIDGMKAPMKAAAPAPMKTMMALPGPYTVYFDFDSFELSATGEAVIKEAAKAGAAAGATGVIVTGHADLSGSDDYNEGLARARSASVGNQLMVEGVARSMIKRQSTGEKDPAVKTEDGKKEARNRRVTITFTR